LDLYSQVALLAMTVVFLMEGQLKNPVNNARFLRGGCFMLNTLFLNLYI